MENKNYHKHAVILEYEKGGTPIVSAKGEKFLADYIVKLARKYNKPIVQKSSLVGALSQVKDETPIPESLYEAVAEILYNIEHKE